MSIEMGGASPTTPTGPHNPQAALSPGSSLDIGFDGSIFGEEQGAAVSLLQGRAGQLPTSRSTAIVAAGTHPKPIS